MIQNLLDFMTLEFIPMFANLFLTRYSSDSLLGLYSGKSHSDLKLTMPIIELISTSCSSLLLQPIFFLLSICWSLRSHILAIKAEHFSSLLSPINSSNLLPQSHPTIHQTLLIFTLKAFIPLFSFFFLLVHPSLPLTWTMLYLS